jgi:hypothetical protein
VKHSCFANYKNPPVLIAPRHSYSNLTAQLIPGAKESSLGQDFIRKYVPAMDFPHQVLYLRPDHSTKTP